MYRVDVFKRTSDGNRGKLLEQHWYPEPKTARNAITALIRVRTGVRACPRDTDARNGSAAEFRIKYYPNIIVAPMVADSKFNN